MRTIEDIVEDMMDVCCEENSEGLSVYQYDKLRARRMELNTELAAALARLRGLVEEAYREGKHDEMYDRGVWEDSTSKETLDKL